MLFENTSSLVFTTIYGIRRFFLTSRNFPTQNTATLIIDDNQEYENPNLQFRSIDIYLSTIIPPSSKRLRLSKDRDMKRHVYTLDTNEHLVDVFQNIQVKWRLFFRHVEATDYMDEHYTRCYELTFKTKHRETVLNCYLPYIVKRSKRMIEECKVTRLYEVNIKSGVTEYPFEFEHPIRLENLAVDREVKSAVKEDIRKFIKGKEWDYECSGKAWKRGYLISGGRGSGKSSLVAAMANELEFDVHDFDVAAFEKDHEYLDSLISCYNASKLMIVIEDIDSIFESLMGVIYKAWSKCGDGKVIVLTTTEEKGNFDPHVFEGIIDLHIEIPNFNNPAFKQLVFNHFGITNHKLYQEIERMMEKGQVNLSEVVAKLMESRDVDVSLQGLVAFLRPHI